MPYNEEELNEESSLMKIMKQECITVGCILPLVNR